MDIFPIYKRNRLLKFRKGKVIKMLKNQTAVLKFRKNQKSAGTVLHVGGAAIGGFLLAGTAIAGGQSPLLVALLGALGITDGVFAFVGGMMAYFFTGTMNISMVEITSALGVLVTKTIFRELMGKNFRAAGNSIITGLTTFLCGGLVTLLTSGGGTAFFIVTCKAVLCGSVTFFMMTVISSWKEEKRPVLYGMQGASLAAVYIVAIASLCSAGIGFFNIGRILGLTVTLFGAKKFRHTGGAICGALTVCGLIMCSADLGKPAMLLALTAMVAGLFADFGNLPTALIFLGTNIASLVLIGVTPENARIVADLIVASAVFVILPENTVTAFLGIRAVPRCESPAVELAASRLDFAAKTIHEIQNNVKQVSKTLERRKSDNDIAVRVCDNVCGKCRSNMLCWENQFDATYEQFGRIKKQLELKGRIFIEELPEELNCFRRNILVEEFNRAYTAERLENHATQRMKDMREILYGQFSSMENLLTELGGEIYSGKECDEQLSKEVKSFLSYNGAIAPKVCVFHDTNGRLNMESYFSGEIRRSEQDLSKELSDILDRNVRASSVSSAGNYKKLTAVECPAISLEIGIASRSGKPNEISGDSYESFNDGDGNAYIILSDGMGSGNMAAVDSCMTTSLFTRLLKAGAGFDSAVQLINSSMLAKSSDESFATLDIAKIDCNTGLVTLIKLGAAATFVKSGGRVSCYESRTLPVGILGEVSSDKKELRMKPGDVLVMASDGVTDECFPYVKTALLSSEEKTSEEISEFILGNAEKLIPESRIDDITVFTVKFSADY